MHLVAYKSVGNISEPVSLTSWNHFEVVVLCLKESKWPFFSIELAEVLFKLFLGGVDWLQSEEVDERVEEGVEVDGFLFDQDVQTLLERLNFDGFIHFELLDDLGDQMALPEYFSFLTPAEDQVEHVDYELEEKLVHVSYLSLGDLIIHLWLVFSQLLDLINHFRLFKITFSLVESPF